MHQLGLNLISFGVFIEFGLVSIKYCICYERIKTSLWMKETLTLLKSETKVSLRARISSHMPRIFQRHSRVLQSPIRFPCNKKKSSEVMCVPLLTDPSHKESTHLQSEFWLWFSQVHAFLPWGRPLKSNALCVITSFRVLWVQLEAVLWKTAVLWLLRGFQFWATYLDKMMNSSLTKPEWDLGYQVLLSSFFPCLFRSRVTN